jgi:aminoglycoside phosphotransferase (APT) family kinase protein
VVFSSESWEPDSEALSAVAAASPEWPYGAIRVRSVTRIGADYGLSGGQIYRVEADCEGSGSVSFVVKREAAQAVERALQFHRAVGPHVVGATPACLGGLLDGEGHVGVLLLEDIAPAEQGDVLAGCTEPQALAAVRSLARVHAAPLSTTDEAGNDPPRWEARARTPEEWAPRLAAASGRFPQILTAELVERLESLPDKSERAIRSLDAADACWIHCDMHLDNVLFRPDGRAVLVDWSGATVGPAAVDLVRLLTEGVNGGARATLCRRLVSVYASELAIDTSNRIEDLWEAMSHALALLAQGAIGWAAQSESREPVTRMRALQASMLRSVCAWAANEQMTKPGRVFAGGD